MWRIIAVMALAQIGAGAIFDLGDYVMDTGGYNTTGEVDEYDVAYFTTGNGISNAFMSHNEEVLYSIESMSRHGFKQVEKPYPGYLKLQNNSRVDYRHKTDSGQIFVLDIAGYDEALALLPQITLRPKADYQAEMGAKLQEVLA